METPNPDTTVNRAPLEVTLNIDKQTNYTLAAWPVNTVAALDEEPSRMSVRRGNLSYSLVMGEQVTLEIWATDASGELIEQLSTQPV